MEGISNSSGSDSCDHQQYFQHSQTHIKSAVSVQNQPALNDSLRQEGVAASSESGDGYPALLGLYVTKQGQPVRQLESDVARLTPV
jgi:hypothetical protein